MAQSYKVECPYCDSKGTIPTNYLGAMIRCLQCGTVFEVEGGDVSGGSCCGGGGGCGSGGGACSKVDPETGKSGCDSCSSNGACAKFLGSKAAEDQAPAEELQAEPEEVEDAHLPDELPEEVSLVDYLYDGEIATLVEAAGEVEF
ncbi:MAG: hypothetical protein NUW37_10295 [Planctomycetes bacterium]|nr:hypothetical protein [Planctomycetota bacterium]